MYPSAGASLLRDRETGQSQHLSLLFCDTSADFSMVFVRFTCLNCYFRRIASIIPLKFPSFSVYPNDCSFNVSFPALYVHTTHPPPDCKVVLAIVSLNLANMMSVAIPLKSAFRLPRTKYGASGRVIEHTSKYSPGTLEASLFSMRILPRFPRSLFYAVIKATHCRRKKSSNSDSPNA